MKKILGFLILISLFATNNVFAQTGNITGEAKEWYDKAQQGDAEAQFYLGVCYYNGEGVNQDYSQAVYWWRKAAEQGLAEAQYNLGVCYERGEGVNQDYSQAVYWYRKAAEQGDEDAKEALRELGYNTKVNNTKSKSRNGKKNTRKRTH